MTSTRLINRTIFSSVTLLAYLLAPQVLAKDYYEFGHYQLEAPFKISQEPIFANLLDNKGKEIILIGEQDKKTKLALFAFDDVSNQYQISINIDLPTSYFSFDVSDEGQDEQTEKKQLLYFLSTENVVQFTPQQQQPFSEIVAVNSIYVNQEAKYLKQANFVTDLNNDGLSDVVLADFRSLNIYLNKDKEGFIKQTLPIYPTVEIFDGSVSYTEQPYYLQDMNFDQSKDIVITGAGELLVFAQQSNGEFSTTSTALVVNDKISGINWWDSRGADGKNIDQSNFSHRTVEHIRDINNDDIPDMVVRFTQSSGVLDKSNDYEIYLGKKQNNNLVYQTKADTMVKSDGTLAALDFIDVNNDNHHEVMASSFDISVSQIIGALLTGSVDQQVLIFSLDSKQNYQQRVNKEVQLKFSLSSGKSGAPVIEIADLDGDGIKELILSDDENRLKIYPGAKTGTLLQKYPQKLDVRLPKNGVLLNSDDLNSDGKSELIVRYGSEDGEGRQSKLLVLYVN